MYNYFVPFWDGLFNLACGLEAGDVHPAEEAARRSPLYTGKSLFMDRLPHRHLGALLGEKIVAVLSARGQSLSGKTNRVEAICLSVGAQRKLYEDYAELEDEQVVDRVRNGDEIALEYLINKYKNFVRAKARSYFLIGADREDIIQEGMIGLYKAIRDFRSEKLASFRAFAELCITRQIITAIKTATRQKHIPLNSYVSLNKPIYDEESDRTLLDVLAGTKVTDPEELVISREEFIRIEKKMGEFLSDLEWKVLMFYLEGKSYQEIADGLDRHVKSIDNALQRVKRKLERYLAKRDEKATG